MEPAVDGAAKVTEKVTLPLGAKSAGSENALLLSQPADCEEPPTTVVKWRSKSTAL